MYHILQQSCHNNHSRPFLPFFAAQDISLNCLIDRCDSHCRYSEPYGTTSKRMIRAPDRGKTVKIVLCVSCRCCVSHQITVRQFVKLSALPNRMLTKSFYLVKHRYRMHLSFTHRELVFQWAKKHQPILCFVIKLNGKIIENQLRTSNRNVKCLVLIYCPS